MTHLARYVVTLLSLATLACGDSESAREAKAMQGAIPQRLMPDGSIHLTPQDKTALGLAVAPATEGDLPESVLRFGRVLSPPAGEGQVVAPVTGRIVRAPVVQLGSTVRAGATLVEILPVLDTPERIAVGTQSAEREAQIEAAERDLAKAEADEVRARSLSPQIVSAAKLQEAETVVATTRAHLEGLRNARTASAQAETRLVPVTAPISGSVFALTMAVGAQVNRGDVLAQIVTAGPLWIDVSVPPDDPVSDGYELATASGPVRARLLARGRVIDTDGTRHDRLVVESPQSGTLTPGSTVSVQVARNVSRGIVLPESALVPGVDGDTVFVESSPGVFTAREVRVAARFGTQVRLSSGLERGDAVVVQGAMGLQGERLRSQLRHVEGQ